MLQHQRSLVLPGVAAQEVSCVATQRVLLCCNAPDLLCCNARGLLLKDPTLDPRSIRPEQTSQRFVLFIVLLSEAFQAAVLLDVVVWP